MRPPKEFKHPWDAIERCEAYGLETHAYVTEKDRGDNPDDSIREAFSKIGGKGPYVGGLQPVTC